MAALKEPIARRANREDGTDGHFWSKRFDCREVHGNNGLLAVGVYNDLNLMRAGESTLPQDSPYCSAGVRFEAKTLGGSVPWLAELTLEDGQSDEEPAADGRRATDRGLLEMTDEQYERLVTWAGTIPKSGKCSIPEELAMLVSAKGLNAETLAELLAEFPGPFRNSLGSADSLRAHARDVGKHWFWGVGRGDEFFT